MYPSWQIANQQANSGFVQTNSHSDEVANTNQNERLPNREPSEPPGSYKKSPPHFLQPLRAVNSLSPSSEIVQPEQVDISSESTTWLLDVPASDPHKARIAQAFFFNVHDLKLTILENGTPMSDGKVLAECTFKVDKEKYSAAATLKLNMNDKYDLVSLAARPQHMNAEVVFISPAQ